MTRTTTLADPATGSSRTVGGITAAPPTDVGLQFIIDGVNTNELFMLGGVYGGTINDSGSADKDAYVVTADFQGVVSINENAQTAQGGEVHIYFDKGVRIASVDANGNVTLAISDDGVTSVINNNRWRDTTYYLGDGTGMTLADFTTRISGGVTVDSYVDVDKLTDYRVDTAGFNITFGDNKQQSNLFSFGYSEVTTGSGFSGGDAYILTRFQRNDAAIQDGSAGDVAIFDYGVEIIGIGAGHQYTFIGGDSTKKESKVFNARDAEFFQIGDDEDTRATADIFFSTYKDTGLPIDLGLSPTLREAWLGANDIVNIGNEEGALVNLSASAVNLNGVSVAAGKVYFYNKDGVLRDGSDIVALDLKAETITFTNSVHSDSVAGTEGNDFIMGNENKNTLSGGGGDDEITGGGGADTLIGGDGDDTLIGDGGADTLVGGGGDDILTGGLNKDTFTASADTDTITDFSDADTLHFNRYSDVASLANLTFTASSDNKNLTIAYTGGQVTLQDIENIIKATNGNYMTYFGEGGDGNDMITIDHTPIFTGTPNDYQKTIKENDFFSLDLKLTRDGNNPLSFAVAGASGLRGDSRKSVDSFISQFKFTNGTLTANGLDRDILSDSDKYGTMTLTITASDTINGGVVSQSVTVTVEGYYDEGPRIEEVHITDASGNNKPAENGTLTLGNDDTYTFTINNNNASLNENENRNVSIGFVNGDVEASTPPLRDRGKDPGRPLRYDYDNDEGVVITLTGDHADYFTPQTNSKFGTNEIKSLGAFASKNLYTDENGVVKERLISTFTLTANNEDVENGPKQKHVVHWHFGDIDDEQARLYGDTGEIGTSTINAGRVKFYTARVSDPDQKTGGDICDFSFTLAGLNDSTGKPITNSSGLFDVTGGNGNDAHKATIEYIGGSVTTDTTYQVVFTSEETDSSAIATHTVTMTITGGSGTPPQEREFPMQTPIEFDSAADGLWTLTCGSTEFEFSGSTQFIWEDKASRVDTKEELQFAFDNHGQGFDVSLDRGDIILEFASDECITINGDTDFTNADIADFDAFIAAIGNPEFG